MANDKPIIFVASSSEQLPVARAIKEILYEPKEWEVRVWDKEFDFTSAYIESLEKALDTADFAVVVMTGNDAANVRQKRELLPRDNVIFELGLFIGRLGRERCAFFFDATSKTKIVSDLAGVKGADYYPVDQALDKLRPSLAERVRAVKRQIREQLRRSGERYKPDADARERQQARWRFLKQIEGPWWERLRSGDDDQSALSLVQVKLDVVTNAARLHGEAFGLDAALLAAWDASAELDLALDGPPTLRYRWEGQHEKTHAAGMGGQGVLHFAAREAPQSGSGYFYDTRLTEIDQGVAPTREKNVRLQHLSADEAAIMQDIHSEPARALVRKRLDELRFP